MNILDSKFYSLLDKLSDFFILNTFWIISCIPIITAGPATAAMFSVVRQWKINQDTSVARNYIRYFKENFKQSFLIGIIWTIISLILYLNYFYLSQDHSSTKYFILIPLLFISLFFIATSAYIFSVITHYTVTWKSAIKNSFFIAIVDFPTTILLFVILSLLTIILIYLPATSLIIFSIGAYLNFSLCNRAFKKFEQIRLDHNNTSSTN